MCKYIRLIDRRGLITWVYGAEATDKLTQINVKFTRTSASYRGKHRCWYRIDTSGAIGSIFCPPIDILFISLSLSYI